MKKLIFSFIILTLSFLTVTAQTTSGGNSGTKVSSVGIYGTPVINVQNANNATTLRNKFVKDTSGNTYFIDLNGTAIKTNTQGSGGASVDTSSLSNRINTKLNLSDTSNTVSTNYRIDTAKTQMRQEIVNANEIYSGLSFLQIPSSLKIGGKYLMINGTDTMELTKTAENYFKADEVRGYEGSTPPKKLVSDGKTIDLTGAVWKNPNISVINGETVDYIFKGSSFEPLTPNNSRSYGAIPNDGIDDTQALQKQVDNEKEVIILSGRYNIDGINGISLRNNQKIYGQQNNTIFQAGASNTRIFNINGVSNIEIFNIRLLKNRTNSSAYVGFISASKTINIHNVNCDSLLDVGFFINAGVGDSTENVNIYKSIFTHTNTNTNDQFCIFLSDFTTNCKIYENTIKGGGIAIQSANGIGFNKNHYIYKNSIINASTYGIMAYHFNNGIPENITIENNTISGVLGSSVKGAGIYFQTVVNSRILNNNVSKSNLLTTMQTLAPGGIGVSNSNNIKISGNTIDSCNYFGIYVVNSIQISCMDNNSKNNARANVFFNICKDVSIISQKMSGTQNMTVSGCTSVSIIDFKNKSNIHRPLDIVSTKKVNINNIELESKGASTAYAELLGIDGCDSVSIVSSSFTNDKSGFQAVYINNTPTLILESTTIETPSPSKLTISGASSTSGVKIYKSSRLNKTDINLTSSATPDLSDLVLQSSANVNITSLASGTPQTQNFTVTGAATGQKVSVFDTGGSVLSSAVIVSKAYVSAANTVTLEFTRLSGTTANLTGTLQLEVK